MVVRVLKRVAQAAQVAQAEESLRVPRSYLIMQWMLFRCWIGLTQAVLLSTLILSLPDKMAEEEVGLPVVAQLLFMEVEEEEEEVLVVMVE
jgi:hypothetical protein